MALESGSGRRSASPEGSGRDSPIPRQWRNQLGGEEELPARDKVYRKYAHGVDRALVLFETALEEWADYISFLNRLLKALQARPKSITTIPAKATVAKRLSQCLNPSLPSGVHQKALEVYNYVFTVIGTDGLSRDLPLYLPGLASTLSFASLSVRAPYLDILERHLLGIDPRSLRPAMKSIILALLPGLEDETSEDFDRTLRMVDSFKNTIRPANSEELAERHSSGDAFFWQCFFLASITSNSRRAGALAYLVRSLPQLGPQATPTTEKSETTKNSSEDDRRSKITAIVASPEPGLLLRCFASGLSDEHLLVQRGFLDLLVSHLPLNSNVIQTRVKPGDLELLLKAAVGVVTRRDMSLNRRLWAWLLGPEPTAVDTEHGPELPMSPSDTTHQAYLASRTSFFEEFGLHPLTRALLQMIKGNHQSSAAERARPYRICLSLMDRWEIGGLVIPEVFLPIIESVRQFKTQASTKAEFSEVLRSASVFFDGIESGLIYGEIVSLLAQAIGPGTINAKERSDKFSLVGFILTNFNVREEEMITIHAPLSALAVLSMLEDSKDRQPSSNSSDSSASLSSQALTISISLLELVPERAFPEKSLSSKRETASESPSSFSNIDVLKKIRTFYVNEQGNIDASPPPFNNIKIGELLLQKVVNFVCDKDSPKSLAELGVRTRLLILALHKIPVTYKLGEQRILKFLFEKLKQSAPLPFPDFSAMLNMVTQLYSSERIETNELTTLVGPLVRHAWSYLSASEPKYHVEAVRGLWQLQSVLTTSNRDIEAALSSLIIAEDSHALEAVGTVDTGRTVGVLWSHTLQDDAYGGGRRGSKTPMLELRTLPRLSGTDNYEVMLTQPLFLILDALQDDRSQLYMTVKAWLNTMLGIDRLFLILVTKLSEIPFLSGLVKNNEKPDKVPVTFSEDEDLDLCLYYLRTLSNILACAGDISWAVLASKHVSSRGQQIQISTGADEEMTLQEFFVRVCIKCITGKPTPNVDKEIEGRINQLYRYALTILHKFFLSPSAAPFSESQLENVLIEQLFDALKGPDPYVQVLLLDVVYDTLKLRDVAPVPVASSPTTEKRPPTFDPIRGSRLSVATSERSVISPPPPQLLKCLQEGLSSPNSRPVLDSWVAFVTECLPFYTESIFQVLIPLVETLCNEIGTTFENLRETFQSNSLSTSSEKVTPESTLIFLLNGLEQVLARGHEQLLVEEARTQIVKSPDQPQSLFGSISGVFQTDAPQSRSATANDRLTVHLAFQDAVRICYKIWTWGQGEDSARQDQTSSASFLYTSLRMRNRARRLLEQLFTAENLECLETVVDIWKNSAIDSRPSEVFNLISALDASRPRHTIPALFDSIYSRSNPGAVEPGRKSTMTIALYDTDLVVFLVEYARSLEDDAMDEIWQDCMLFLKDLLGNPFPHRQTLPNLLEFAGILGEKVDNTNFGEQRRMRRELGDTFLRLLAALFTTKPIAFADPVAPSGGQDKTELLRRTTINGAAEGPDDVVAILASIVPNLTKILVEPDRVLSAAGTISTNVIGPSLRAKGFPDTFSKSTLHLLQELSRLQNNQKTWKKDVGDAFNDAKFFGMNLELARQEWIPLLRQWTLTDKEKMPEIVSRINAPTTAGIVFGVGATSARLEADRKTQLNLRRIATLVLAAAEDAFVTELNTIFDKLVELFAASATSSPSSTTRADIYIVIRALALKTSAIHLGMLWPVVNAEIHTAISSVVAPDNSTASDTYTNGAILQACKLLDLLICVAPDDFQLHEWLFITDTIDAVYRSSTYQPVALVDEISEELGAVAANSALQTESVAHLVASSSARRPLLGPGGISDDVSLERKDELVAKVLRPFFGQLSIFAFESTYAMGRLDREACILGLLKDIFDERSIVKAL
ncbi:Dopey, N-terminal-domain-containing protein [Dactylonectria macrodidyma]|uniref:Dopey, N-terminal-domain-containing protein n=1 Tax=Dactylonectria macrodidyma TaxID=307937 RepID=A0A9P9FQ25_9HYPO|nr:Dopey, N-terminal-domain-containing protein [Dactylonectria macrodidyma]